MMGTYISTLAREEGLEMLDADEPLELVLNSRDIKTGITQDPERCAFAKACRRQDEEKVIAVHVFLHTAWVQYSDRIVRYHLPPSVRAEVISFDRGGRMAAGTYQFSPPPPSAKLGVDRTPSVSTNRKRKSKPRHYTTDVRQVYNRGS